MASIQKSGKGYRAFVCVNGTRDSQSFRTKREADAWAGTRETELRLTKQSIYSVKQMLTRYKEEVSPGNRGERWEVLRIDAFIRTLPPVLIHDLTPGEVAKWRDARLKSVSPGTVLRELGLLSAVFEVAIKEWAWASTNPVKGIRKPSEPPHRDRVLTRQEIRAMLQVMGYKRNQVRGVSQAVAHAFLLALRTGMRAGEICNLTWHQVKPGYLAKVGTKTVPRDVPLSPKATRLIESLRGYDPTLVVGIKSQSLDALFRKYRRRAGLSGFTFHDTRHTAATWMAQKLHVLELCKVFGWANTKRALTYFNPKASDIATRL
jgi:integrase